jgi:3D (Asp-Asp-Asp) domain-containing protein
LAVVDEIVRKELRELTSRGALPSQGRESAQKELVVQATAYSHTGDRTYSGTWPREGWTIAVDPATIPIGSRVYIKELNNWYIAEDRIPEVSIRKGAKIDIFMDREADAWKWGRRDVRVVVEPPEKR